MGEGVKGGGGGLQTYFVHSFYSFMQLNYEKKRKIQGPYIHVYI